MKDSGDFVNKIKELQSITDGTTLVTSDAVPYILVSPMWQD